MNNFQLLRHRLHEVFPKVKFILRVGKPTRRAPKIFYVVWVNGPTEGELREQIRLALGGQETDPVAYSQSEFELLCARAASQSGKSIRDMAVRLIEQFEPLRRKHKRNDADAVSPRSERAVQRRGAQ